METKEYRSMDKSKWEPGPWMDEPDKRQWQDAATGLPCLIVRNSMGALCGYVGVAEGHPWFGMEYSRGKVLGCGDSCEDDYHYQCSPAANIRVHGGITFADFCQDSESDQQDVSGTICHVPGEGEPDHVWWFGFDCGHCDDVIPAWGDRQIGRMFGYPQYRDIDYVTEQVTHLAAQLAKYCATQEGQPK